MSEQQPEVPAIPGVITLDELAEAFDHEIDGCYVGGQEFAVNVFAYVRDHRPAPEPLIMPADEFAAVRTVWAAAEGAAWTPEQIAEFRERFEVAMANPGPLRVLPSDRWKDRAEAAEAKVAEAESRAGEMEERYDRVTLRIRDLEAAEAKLSEIAAGCREAIDRNASQGVTLVSAAYILGMADGGTEKEPRDG